MHHSGAVTSPPSLQIRQAFQDLNNIVASSDATTFYNTTLADVYKAVTDIERELVARQRNCNAARLAPLFQWLEHYCRPIEVLCNGTPYLPWVWAPIKLILQIAKEHLETFKILVGAYHDIAKVLPRFDRLKRAFEHDPHVQQATAIFCVSLARFHKEAYKLLKKNDWSIFFNSLWGRFQYRFKGIIEDLKEHAEMVKDEAATSDIINAERHRVEMREWHIRSMAKIDEDEERFTVTRRQAALAWLEYRASEQGDILDYVASTCVAGTSGWIKDTQETALWLRDNGATRLLALIGKPGAGKTVLMSQLINFAKHLYTGNAQATVVVYHFCTRQLSTSTTYGVILRSIVAQLLNSSDDLVAYVYDEIISKANTKPPTSSLLETLIMTLLVMLPDHPTKEMQVKFFIDGVDEIENHKQRETMLRYLQKIAQLKKINLTCKVMLSSRDDAQLRKKLKADSILSLKKHHSSVTSSIATYVQLRFTDIKERVHESTISQQSVDNMKQIIVQRANGMFLWARLVCDLLDSGYFDDEQQMLQTVEEIPRELSEFYQQILENILARQGRATLEKIRSIVSWIAFAERPLQPFELLAALAIPSSHLAASNIDFRLPPPLEIFDTCKPLIEMTIVQRVDFVHGSVREFLLSADSGPFITQSLAASQQAQCCLRALLSTMDTFTAACPVDERAKRMALGVHGLHIYADKYWAEYVLRSVDNDKNSVVSNELLFMQFCRRLNLQDVHSDLQPRADVQEVIGALEQSQSDIGQAVLRQLQRLQAETLNSDDNVITKPDLPILDQVLRSYQSLVQELLSAQQVYGVTHAQLELFKKNFRSSAFTCRLKGCDRATIGFESDEVRQDHERAHGALLRCTFVGCFYDLPFATLRALKAHVLKKHTSVETRTKPLRLRKVDDLHDLRASASNSSRDHRPPRDPVQKIMKRFYTNTPHPIVESAQEMSGRNGTKPTVEEFMAKRQQFVTNLQTLQAQVEAQFQVGAEVLYRKGSSKVFDPNDGEGMLCRVTSVIGEGKQRRYLILDAGPDITDAPHRASLQQMMFIPPIGTVLPELKPKANVLALYPSTTTFYKAEVVTGRKKEGHEELAAGYVRLLFEGDVELLFEGEDDAELAKDVERRYVLLDWTVK